MGILDIVPPGVVTGDNLKKLLQYAKQHSFAIPAFNCTSSSTVNAALEAAKVSKSPVIIQVSNGGGAFFCGKAIDNKNERASVLGSVAAAHYIRQVAKAYEVPVVIHSDHCAKKLLPWFDGMLKADEGFFKLTWNILSSMENLYFLRICSICLKNQRKKISKYVSSI